MDHNMLGIKSKGMTHLMPLILFFFGILMIIPTPRPGLVKQYYDDYENFTVNKLVETVDCNIKINNNAEKSYIKSELGLNLTIYVDITSTEPVRLKIQDINGVIFNSVNNIFLTNITCQGPSLVIKMHNPLDITLRRAKLAGKILIYSHYIETRVIEKYDLVNGTIYKPWWMK